MSVFRKGLMSGKAAIVTGGGTGIGKAITMELVSLGCKVIIASRKEEKLLETVKELNRQGNLIIPKVCNIRKEDQVKDLVSFAVSTFGKIDFLVNNGGGQFPSKFEHLSVKGWNAVVDTNLNGTFLMCKEVYDQSMNKHGGSIVNIIADYHRGFPIMSHTGAARAAVDNLTKTLAVEWVDKGIRINSIVPGSNIYSPTAAANYGSDDIFDQAIQETPMKRTGTTQEIASGVVFLLSPGASFITGTSLRIDGGLGLYGRLSWFVPKHSEHPAYQWDYKNPEDGDDGTPSSKL